MIRWIDDFLALAEYKNFSTAADSIYISQSALSKHIKAIENELGVILFLRNSTKAELTDAGKIYLEYALNIRKFTHDLHYKLDQAGMPDCIIHLSMGTIPCLAECGLMKSLIQFQEKNSNYSLDISESDQNQLLRQLTQKEIDIAICRLDLLSAAEYETISLVTDEMVLICRKDMFPFEQGSEIDLSAFHLDKIYTLSKESDIFRLAKKQLNEIGFKGEVAGTFPRHMILFSVLSQKTGCALLPMQLANLQLFPQLTFYRIRNAVKTQIGFAKLPFNPETMTLTEKTSVLFDYFRNHGENN